jgi:hypothetical protein
MIVPAEDRVDESEPRQSEPKRNQTHHEAQCGGNACALFNGRRDSGSLLNGIANEETDERLWSDGDLPA